MHGAPGMKHGAPGMKHDEAGMKPRRRGIIAAEAISAAAGIPSAMPGACAWMC
jgi:hypothetical protein